MKNIYIPQTVEAYRSDLIKRAFPDKRIVDNDFYGRLVSWIIDHRTPLLYDETHPDERRNLSINFNWMVTRDYSDRGATAEPTMMSLYSLHEFTHMTQRLATRLSEITRSQYEEDFTISEYRASNESEIQIYYRIPELRNSVFQNMTLAVDLMHDRHIAKQPVALLNKLRALLIESDRFDYLLGDDPAVKAELARIKKFNGNREWSAGHFDQIKDLFSDPTLPQSIGLTDAEFEEVIADYRPQLTQQQYEKNIIRNVHFAYLMCKMDTPTMTTIDDAITAAKDLEGHHALI